MKRQSPSGAQILISLLVLASMTLGAAEIPNPGVSQKRAIEKMHQKLHDDQAPFKTTEAQALKELNEMTIREDVKIDEVNAKIDELMAAKTQIMRLRYDHLIEMRTILSEDQKINYDKAILNRSEIK